MLLQNANLFLKKNLGYQLSSHCTTRWIERHDSLLELINDLPLIVQSLLEISTWHDSATASKAHGLYKVTTDCEFIFSIFCLNDIMCLTRPLSITLQTKTLDLSVATSKVKELRATLGKKRDDAQNVFKQIFEKAVKVMEKLDIEVKVPRITKRQRYRDNFDVSSDDIYTYWRLSIYIPLLDEIIHDFDIRFSGDNMQGFNLNFLVPSNLTQIINNNNLFNNAIEKVSNQYSSLLNSSSYIIATKLEGELKLIESYLLLNHEFKNINSAHETLNNIDSDNYPIFTSFIKVLVTLPISVATAERSFSSLRLLKTWLRARMTEERLTGLALMYIHKNINIDNENNIENIANRFSKEKKRKIDFVL